MKLLVSVQSEFADEWKTSKIRLMMKSNNAP